VYVVVIEPTPLTPVGGLIVSREGEGPFDDLDVAYTYAARRQATVGQTWRVRVVRIVEPLRSIVARDAA
jgi:hypothetical protein